MVDILSVLISILKIDCGIVQCTYPNEIEALFYLFFFPTIFIILFIYILTNFIFRGGGKIRGLRLLIAIAAYAFIVFESLFTSVVAISHLWWLLTIILVGLFAFIRFLFTGGKEEGAKGAMAGVDGEQLDLIGRLRGKAREAVLEKTGLETDKEKIERKTREEILRVKEKVREHGVESLKNYEEKVVYLLSQGIEIKEGADVDKLLKTLKKSH